MKILNKYKDNSHLQVYVYSYYTETMGQGKLSHAKADIVNILNLSRLSLSLSLSPLSVHSLILKQLIRVTLHFIFFWYSFILTFPWSFNHIISSIFMNFYLVKLTLSHVFSCHQFKQTCGLLEVSCLLFLSLRDSIRIPFSFGYFLCVLWLNH